MTGLVIVTLCSFDNFSGISSNRPADRNKFRNVESAFAQLELGHEGLALPEALAQLHLRYARVLPSLHQQVDYAAIEIGTNRGQRGAPVQRPAPQ